MFRAKMLNHKDQVEYDITGRDEGRKFFNDISKDGVIVDPIEVFKGMLLTFAKEDEEKENPETRMVMSDSEPDRDDERVLVKGWDLKEYKKNPLLLWSHERSRPAIGYMKDLKKGDTLSGIPVFIDKTIDHFGWSIGQKLFTGFLKAGSVGFMPTEWKFIDDKEDPCWMEFMKQELLEFSICNVPSNPRARIEAEVATYSAKSLEAILKSIVELQDMLKEKPEIGDKPTVLDRLGKAVLSVQELSD